MPFNSDTKYMAVKCTPKYGEVSVSHKITLIIKLVSFLNSSIFHLFHNLCLFTHLLLKFWLLNNTCTIRNDFKKIDVSST